MNPNTKRAYAQKKAGKNMMYGPTRHVDTHKRVAPGTIDGQTLKQREAQRAAYMY
jgi:hypothetical protein